jgi:predicted secreted protein
VDIDGDGARLVNLSEADNSRTVSLASGGQLVVKLAANHTTGAHWDVTKLDESVVRKVGNTYTEDPNRPPHIVGRGGYETWTFEAVAPGTTLLQMEYRRWWESGPPWDTFGVTVEVTK